MGMDTFHTWLIRWQNKGGGPPLSPPAPCPKPCLKSKFSYTHVSPCTTSDMFQGCENSNSVLHLPFSQPLASEERSGSMRVLQSESENSFQHYTPRHPEICQWPRKHKFVTSGILPSLCEAMQHHTAVINVRQIRTSHCSFKQQQKKKKRKKKNKSSDVWIHTHMHPHTHSLTRFSLRKLSWHIQKCDLTWWLSGGFPATRTTGNRLWTSIPALPSAPHRLWSNLKNTAESIQSGYMCLHSADT